MIISVKKGFTIVDTLVGLMVISVVVIALYLTFVAATLIQTRARQITIATAEAEKAIEVQRNRKFSDLIASPPSSTIAGLPAGQLNITISSFKPDGCDLATTCTLKKINATVSWKSGGLTRQATLETLATKWGLNDVVP